MLKLFAFDLDGTLLQEGRIRGRNRDILKRLAAHHTIVLVSGRPLASVQYVAHDAGLPAYAIGCNGAVAADPIGRVLFTHPMKEEATASLLALCERFGVYGHYYTADAFYSPYYWPERIVHLEAEPSVAGFHMQCNIHIFGIGEPPELSGALKFQYTLEDAAVARDMEDAVAAIPTLRYTYSGGGLLEAMEEHVDKWETVRAVAETLGISSDAICAMGDYFNDVGMIEHAGVGVAMGNAPLEVQTKADWVTHDVDDDGAFYALERLRQKGFWHEEGEDPMGAK